MPIFRTLILGLAVWLAIQIIRRMLRQHRPSAAPQKNLDFIETVACQHCDVRLPRDEALTRNAHYYCCPQHRDAK